ncbi:MAG: ABC transporter ATP-binding protein [Lachnospiraceae bacterium]|nr:ABC transporter ATP-binding protein [Lachnospiraceae bacterium]
MDETKNIIKLSGVRKSYDGKVNVIEDLSLDIAEGEFVTLLGPSGCGKTTILRMIGGFDKPTEGEILLDGSDITKLPPNERPVNTVFQKYALFPHLNVYDNIAFGLKLNKVPRDEIDKKVSRVLELVDLEGFEKRSISTLSGGQQQRIAIARAVVNEPRVLLLDESLSALDYKMRKEMQLELKSMHKRLGITFIFVTHDQEEALTMSDKVVVLADGKVQQVGTPEEIYNEPANVFVADFIGESNIFNGIMCGRRKASFAGADFDCVDDYETGKKIEAVIRPEDVVITDPDKGILTGEVTSADFKGTFYITFIQCGKYEMEVHSLDHYKPGTMVGLNVDPDNIHIIPYDMTINNFEGIIDGFVDGKGLYLVFKDFSMFVEEKRVFPESHVVKGRLVDKDDNRIELAGRKIVGFFEPEDGDISDDEKEGDVVGKIVSFHYIGDHYNYTVRTDNDIDYVVDEEDLWNQDDKVSVLIPKDKMIFTLVGEDISE